MQIELFKHQLEFMKSKCTHTAIVGGFGCGKSFIGVAKTVEMKLAMPGVDVAYYLPTYPLIRDMAFQRFSDYLDLRKIPYTLHETNKEFITPYGRIIMRSMDNPSLIVAYETGYAIIDEADVVPKNKIKVAFRNILARNRANLPNGEKNKLDFVSTPEGFNFMYNFFVKEASNDKLLINAKTEDNTTLGDDYIENIKKNYTINQQRAYLYGEFVNIENDTVYGSYNREECRHNLTPITGELLYVGVDFNITNMNAVIHIKRDRNFYAVGEIAKAYNTQSICEQLKVMYPNHNITINPDASGNARNSNSTATDFSIFKKAGFKVDAPRKNPKVQERVNSLNLAFETKQYFIDDTACPIYAESLEKQSYKDGVPDKTSGYDHITEAGGYSIYRNLFNKKIRTF
jgi:phage terminase large subunit